MTDSGVLHSSFSAAGHSNSCRRSSTQACNRHATEQSLRLRGCWCWRWTYVIAAMAVQALESGLNPDFAAPLTHSAAVLLAKHDQ